MLKQIQIVNVLLVLLGISSTMGCAGGQVPGRTIGQRDEPREQVVVVKTGQGQFVIEFYPESAPVTVGNFKKLVTKGFFDGLTFWRRVHTSNLSIIQGGDPEGNGTGGPGYTIVDEYTNHNQRPHLRGTVAMARTDVPNSAGSQFYICLQPQPFLDGRYTTFGRVVQGMESVDKLRIGDIMQTVRLEAKSKYVKYE